MKHFLIVSLYFVCQLLHHHVHGRIIPATLNIGFIYSQITLSGLVDFSGNQYFAAFLMALSDLSNKNDGLFDHILPNTTLRYTARSSRRSFVLGVRDAISLRDSFDGNGVVGVVGPVSNEASTAVALVFNEYDILSVSYGARYARLSQSNTYKYLMRTVPSESIQGRTLAHIIDNHFNWKILTVFMSSDTYSSYAAGEFKYAAEKHGITILSSHVFGEGRSNFDTITDIVKSLGSRIFVLFMNYTDAAVLLEKGYDSGIFKEGVQILGVETTSTSNVWKAMTVRNDVASIMKGFIGLEFIHNSPDTATKADFVQRWRSQTYTGGYRDTNGNLVCNQAIDDDVTASSPFTMYEAYVNSSLSSKRCVGFNFSQDFLADGSNIDPKVYYAYDATIALAQGLHDMLHHSEHPLTGGYLKQTMVENVSFTGLTGHVSFSKATQGSLRYGEGDREGGVTYKVVNFQPSAYSSQSENQGFVTVGYWTTETGYRSCLGEVGCSAIVYNTASNTIPTDTPAPISARMSPGLKGFVYTLGTICGLLVIVMSFFVIYHRKTKVIRASQTTLLYFILLGGALSVVRIIDGASDIKDADCITRVWFGHLAFALVFFSLIVKAYRVHRIVNTSNFKRVIFSTKKAVLMISAMLFLLAVYLAFMTVYGDPHLHIGSTTSKLQTTYTYECQDTNPGFAIFLYVVEGLMLAYSGWLSQKIKEVPDSVNESAYIAYGKPNTVYFIYRANEVANL
jgi:ABC-type branched-subunit amino acid transport system substrate-binding protein